MCSENEQSNLHLFSFKTPTSLWCRQMPTLKADLSDSVLDKVQNHKGDADLWLPTSSATEALEMRNGVKGWDLKGQMRPSVASVVAYG